MLILILAAFVLICIVVYLAVTYWYISIPLIILGIIYSYREPIRERMAKNAKIKSQREYYEEYSSQQNRQAYQEYSSQNDQEGQQEYSSQQNQDRYQKNLDILKIFKISQLEAESILGKDWESLTSIETLYCRTVEIGLEKQRIVKIPKYLIFKFSEIFESVYQMYYKSAYSNINSAYDRERDNTEQNYKEILENCKECYENYTRYKMNHKSYEQSNSYERDDSKTNDSDNKNDNNYSRSENEHNYGHWKYEENYSGKKSSSKYAKARAARVKARLEKYQITANDAEIIFGKNWEEKLGKPEVDFYFMVMKIAIKIQFDFSGRYKRKYGKLYDKVLKIIDILIEENPEMDGGYDKNYKEKFKEEFRKQNGDKRYGDQWNYDDWFNEDNQDKDYSHNRNYGFGNQSQYSNKAIENAYSEMELKQEATDAEIKSKYRELILKYHPDRNKGSTYATEKTVKINLAFEIIMGVRKSA